MDDAATPDPRTSAVSSTVASGDGDGRYVFTSSWTVPAPAQQTFAVLRDVAGYVSWWPEFRQGHQITADRAEFVLRSVLPVSLRFTLERDIEDATTGHLRAMASGDIEGSVEWRVAPLDAHTSRADFREDVLLKHRWARHLQRVLRPALVLNHSWAMRSGQHALTRHVQAHPPVL